jgi:hypothetical protein
MDHAKAFGRRAVSREEPKKLARPAASSAAIPPPQAVDQEFAEWKRANRHLFRFPWRLFSLMAGLCFGIASFVLPDRINQIVQWPLYALSAASFYAGLRHK